MQTPASTPAANARPYRWWHGALFLTGVTALSALSAGRRRQRAERRFYEQQKLPVWAPPGAAFPIIWPLNNAALVWGGLRLLNAPRQLPHRRALLGLQGLLWLDFLTFSSVYFGLRSPVLSAVWTLADASASVGSLLLARRTGDARLPWAYLPITAWTGFASTVALYDALRNPDAFLGTPPLLRRAPVPALEKSGQ